MYNKNQSKRKVKSGKANEKANKTKAKSDCTNNS